MKYLPLNFSTARFDSLQFNESANFKYAKLGSTAYFMSATFDSTADFEGATFGSTADFRGVTFDSTADFEGVTFGSKAYFESAKFGNTAYFMSATFDSTADFRGAEFDSTADFGGAEFQSAANFLSAEFHSTADFSGAEFHSTADFGGVEFHSMANFLHAEFHSMANFTMTDFKKIVLRSTVFNSNVYLGELHKQEFDFTEAIFNPDVKIILCDLAELNLQTERVKHIAFAYYLRYSLKRRILDNLKNSCFKENKMAQFELDYIFHKSTMFQHQIDTEIMGFHKMILNCIYYITMGFGYRPFRLAYWVFGIIIIYSLIYFWKLRQQINHYIFKEEKQTILKTRGKRFVRRTGNVHPVDLFINCLYFSSTMFLTVRLKKDVLTSFQREERWMIISEYILGLLIYIAFLTLSKSGSILHNLKSLFVG